MKVLICEEVRPQLEEYHDDELPVSDQIAVRAHLEWCDECSSIFTDLRLMRGFIRASAPGQLLHEHEERCAFEADKVDVHAAGRQRVRVIPHAGAASQISKADDGGSHAELK